MISWSEDDGCSMKKIITTILIAVVAVAVMPTTLLLFVGMMPSIAAYFIDKTKQQLKAMTVGCLNFSACFYYWLELVSSDHSLVTAWEIISPTSISIMYAGAIAGYIVEWGVSMAVAVVMVQSGKSKLSSIRKQKEEMVERWGVEVTGVYRLDVNGFLLPKKDDK